LKHLFELFLFLFLNKKAKTESLIKLFNSRQKFIKKPIKRIISDRFKILKTY
jgi:F0F1-type ATP synthase membrane subunit b/b'